MRGKAFWFALFFLCGLLLQAATDIGVSAKCVPDKVRPGELFELLVEMNRADYAEFELHLPAHERLHRVAVEAEPVKFKNGRYHQRERWWMQANASGKILIENATLTFASEPDAAPVKLPPLRMEVLPYAEQDQNLQPLDLPPAENLLPARFNLVWWLIALPGIAVATLFFWKKRSRFNPSDESPATVSPLEGILMELESGTLNLPALERLLVENAHMWPEELRAVVEQAVYARQPETGRLAALLREEARR